MGQQAFAAASAELESAYREFAPIGSSRSEIDRSAERVNEALRRCMAELAELAQEALA